MIGAMMVVTGAWKKDGVFNVEEFDPDPFMDALNKWGLPWQVCEDPQIVEQGELENENGSASHSLLCDR